MNKIFKVVWSKTKECYVVVSEVAKNNSGKKKVLASVLAALAVVGAGAGVSVQAADMNTDTSANTAKQINIWANTKYKGNPAAGGSNAVGTGTANSNNVRPSDYGDEISLAIGNYNVVSSTDTKSPASGGSSYAIGNGNQLKGNRNIAVGTNNKTYGDDSIAMGNQSISGTGHSIAIGSISGNKQTVAYGSQNPSETGPSAFGFALAIGAGAQADGRANSTSGGIAIGQEVTATNTNSIVIGQTSEASGSHAITIGRGSSATSTGAMAFGYFTNATGPASLAIGRQTNAKAYKSVAIGPDSIVNAQRTSSSYEFSGSNGTSSPAGYKTETITVNSGSAPASGPVAGNYYNAGSAVAIGDSASVSDASSGAVVVGPNAKTNGNAHYSVVLGSGSHADASDGFVAGHGSYVESRESIAMGSGANVSGNENIRSQAIGFGATVTGTGAYDATAIGSTAQVSGVQGGVALGSGSLLSRTTNSNENAGWNSKSLNGTAIRNRAYTAGLTGNNNQWDSGSINTGAVSVGNDTQKRQIINVAAGSQDTDAVNVAQLKNVGVRVGADTNTATIGTNKVAADFLAYNGQLNIKGDNNRVTTVSENDVNGKDANVNVKFDYDGLVKAKTGSAVTVDQKTDGNGKTYFEIDAAAASKTVLADGKNTTVTGAGTTASPYKVNVEGALTGISSITNNGGGKIEFTTGGTTISGGPVNVSNNKITGVANGDVNATSTDAVNGSQLYAVKAAERHIKPTTTGSEYTVDSNGDVTMTYLDGNNNAVAGEKAVIKGIAKQDLSNITNEGKKEITKLGTIVKAGDNVNVSESSDATTGRTTYTVSAVTPAVYTKADGTKVYKRPDGTFTTNSNLAAGNNVDKGDVITSFMDGNGNTTGGNMVINNVGSAIDKTGTSTGNTFLTKLDTAATNTPNAAVNVKDLKNTSDALINKGLNFTGNNDATVNAHKLGSLVKVQGEGVAATDVPSFASAAGNIAVVANGTDTLELKLNKNLKGINSISNGSSSITLNSNPGGTNNTPAVQITGGNLSMGNGTTNNKIVNLAPGTNDTDAVNYSQIKGLRTEVKQGANVTVSKTQGTDGHDIYTISAAATGGTASSWNIKSSADTANGGATATGHNANAVNISDQKTVEMVAGKNLTVKQDTTTDGAKVELALSDNIVAGKDGVNGKDGSVGATGKDGSSVVINGADGSIGMTGPKGQDGKDGINGRDGANISMTSAKGEQVLVNRDPAHSADTDKAERIVYVPKDASGNPIQGADGKNIVREVATMDDGLKFAGDDAQGTDKSKVIAKKLNNTVDIIGGADKDKLTNNNIGVNNDNGKLKVQLAKTIDLTKDGSVTTGNTKVDNSGVTITAPTGGATTNVTLTQSGLDNGGNKIVNVKAGDVNATSTDAVNGSQLYAVKAAERHIAPTTTGHEYTVDNNGDVTMTYLDGNNNAVANEKAVIKGIAKNDLSNITNEGKKEITKLGTIVKAGDNVNVSESSDATTGRTTYTVNAVTPAVYTKADGTKVYKRPDGTFTTNSNLAAGNNVDKGDVITSFMDGNGNTTGGNMVINNVGSAIDKTGTSTGNTFLTKLDTAATNTPNAAVNVKDLKNTSDALINKGLNFTGNNDATVNAHKLGSLVKVQGEGVAATDVPSFASAAGNIAVVANGTDTLELKLNKNLKGINSISNGSSSITLNSNPGGTNNTPAVQITGGNLSMGNGTTNNKIVNLAPGTNDTDAVNYSQIKGLRTEVKQGANVTVSKTQGTDGHDIYTISAAATGGTASSWNIKSSADTANGGATATGHNANAVNISDQKTVEMVAGKNLTVKQDTTTDGAKVELALSDNIVAGKDGVNGKDGSVGATGKDGSSVVINGADGSIGMTGPKGQDGKDGINGRDGANISMTSAKGEQVLVNRDPAHSADTDKAERIVYVPKDASGNPIQGADGKNIVREVATMDDGLKFAGDDAQGTDKSKVIAKKLNNTVDIIGGADKDKLTDNNIGVNNDGNGKLKVQLSKEITGLTSVQIGGNTIKTDGDHITITSPDTTPGATPGATVTHKVANLSDEMHIRDTVYTVSADKKVTLTYVDGNGNPVNNKTAVIDLSGLPVGDKDTDMRIKEGTYTAQNGTVTLETVNKDGSTANKDVVIKGINTNQYKAGDNVTFIQDGTDTNGNPIYKINADLSGASSTEKVIRKNDTNNLAKVDTQSTHAAGEKGETYIVSVDKNDVKDAAREAVEVTGSGVIKVTADNTTTPHKTTYDVAYDSDKAAEVTKISYKSSTSPDAGSQGPKKVSLKDGFDFKSTGGNVKITTDNAGGIDFNVDLSGIHGVSQNIAVGGNVDPTSLTGTDTVTKGTRFDAGNNLVVKRTALNDTGLDHAISYELNKDLQGINSIRNANNGPVMNFNAGDIAISGGNLSMGDGTHNNKIVNVAPGTDKSDVATVGQLTKVVSSNGTVTIAPVYKDQDGAPVYDLSVTGVPGADPRVDQLAEEIGRVGAQGAALSALKPIQYDPLEPTQIMAGYGNYRGNSAVALGVAHYKNESTLIHGGVSWAGGSSHMMANAGVTWKVGNRDSEAAVADRYRKGPISSAYAMQQEMASVKAQNAGLKSEVSDLKAENEQMKAQIAAMMAKLGM